MVQPDHAGGGDQIMVIVLKFGKALGQVPDPAVENVRQVRDTMLALAAVLTPFLDGIAQQVAHRFGTAFVRPFTKQGIERGGKFVINRDCYALHRLNLQASLRAAATSNDAWRVGSGAS